MGSVSQLLRITSIKEHIHSVGLQQQQWSSCIELHISVIPVMISDGGRPNTGVIYRTAV